MYYNNNNTQRCYHEKEIASYFGNFPSVYYMEETNEI